MIEVREHFDLSQMTTFGLPAKCGRLVICQGEDLPELDREGILNDAIILGGGSNMLFLHDLPSRTVIHLDDQSIQALPFSALSASLASPAPRSASPLPSSDFPKGTEPEDCSTFLVRVAAGMPLDNLCSYTCDHNLWGMENLSGIPGCVGGAAVQNVGAYGAEFKDVVKGVHCYSLRRHSYITIPVEQCAYGYRDSIFKHLSADDRLIVTEVTIAVSHTSKPNLSYKGLAEALGLQATSGNGTPVSNPASPSGKHLCSYDIRKAVIALRDSKLPDPAKTGSAGSFFKNPVVSPEEFHRIAALAPESKTLTCHTTPDGGCKLSAAWLIDNAGCKSLTCGGAALWQKQPLVIVNATGKATGADVLALEKAVIDRVREKFGVTLSPEVVHIPSHQFSSHQS